MIFADYPGHFFVTALLAVTAGLIILAFQCRQMQKEKIRPYRLLLMGLCYASIVILLLILCNPSHSVLVDVSARNSVLVFFDTSKSFSVKDVGTTRLDKAIKVFEERFHSSNTQGPEYKIFGFDNQVYRCGSTKLLRRWGNQTDIESVLAALGKLSIAEPDNRDSSKKTDSDEKVKYDNDSRLQLSKAKGAVIFTDGQVEKIDTTYLPFVGDDFPIVIVGIGSREDNPDVAIKTLDAPARVAINSIYNVKVVVTAGNLDNEIVVIELFKDDKIIDSKQIKAKQFLQYGRRGKSNVTVQFTVGADSLGGHSLLARARKVKHEVNAANNVLGTMVEVIEAGKINVLFYTQAANFNVGKLRQVLVRDNRVQLKFGLDAIKTVGLSSESSEKLGYVKLPQNREEFNKYDIVILGHCLLESLTEEQIDGLYSFVVKRGGGLVLLPGRGDFGPGAWRNRKIRTLLPIIFNEGDSKLWPPNPCKVELTPEGRNGQIFNPDDFQIDGPEISAFYRISKVKPAASTLATSGGIPLISIHRVGRGRVCLLNISRLFMWYREDEQGGLLYKLVSGLVSCLGKIPEQTAGVELFVERSNTQDDKVTFSAYVCDSSFNPVEQANVLLNIKDRTLTMEPVGRGYFVVESDSPEEDAITVTAQAEIGGVFLGEKTIAVNLPSRRTEMTDTQFNEKSLQTLAERIKGTYIYADDIDRDMAKMFDSQTHIGTARNIVSIWPSWFLFALLCIILSMEWFIRRTKGLM